MTIARIKKLGGKGKFIYEYMGGLENAVDAISDAEKPISQRISERTI
jgi:hypothetical protein